MEITKIYSDLYDEERLYSVLMSEEELSWFSEVQKEFTGAVKAANKAAKRAWMLRGGAADAEEVLRVGKNVSERKALSFNRGLNASDANWAVNNYSPNARISPSTQLNRRINLRSTYDLSGNPNNEAAAKRLMEGATRERGITRSGAVRRFNPNMPIV